MSVVGSRRQWKKQPERLSEREIQLYLIQLFDWQKQMVIPNVNLYGGEMDLCLVSRAGLVTEIEIKLSLADWRHDIEKGKWADPNRNKVSKFWYCVPKELADKIPDWVPEDAGVFGFEFTEYGRMILHTVRRAKKVSSYKVGEKELEQFRKVFYYRFWPLWIKQSKEKVKAHKQEKKKEERLVESISPIEKMPHAPRSDFFII